MGISDIFHWIAIAHLLLKYILNTNWILGRTFSFLHAEDTWDPFYKLYLFYEKRAMKEDDHQETDMGEYSYLRGKHDKCVLDIDQFEKNSCYWVHVECKPSFV